MVFVAGRASHGFMSHAHNAGCLLLARLLEENVPGVACTVYEDGQFPPDEKLDRADCVVVFCDGGGGNLVLRHLESLDRAAQRGAGICFLHYTLDVPAERGGALFRKWIGGAYETHWSVNPTFVARFQELPDHPVARGVRPFTISDEWYFHMRFRPEMKGVTPILTCVPPDSARSRRDGAHSNNPTVRARKGFPEHVAWAAERPGGGRGFGFTGGHWHYNWAHDDFRKVVLNGIAWAAGIDIPHAGIETPRPTFEALLANQDGEPWPEARLEQVRQTIESWSAPAP